MTKMNVDCALSLLAEGGNSSDGTLYMETGKYKPWSMPVIAALRRRGYRIEPIVPGVFRLYPKQSTGE